MSPANRRYMVRFIDWSLYQTVVLAASMDEAIAKAQKLYQVDGLGDFTFKVAGDEGWEAEEIDGGVRS